jgi:hypothetical protein
MQKLEARNQLREIVDDLLSATITNFIDAKGSPVARAILAALIESKAGYDRLRLKDHIGAIFVVLGVEKYYDIKLFGELVGYIGGQGSNSIGWNSLLTNAYFGDFYAYHRSLINTLRIMDNLMFKGNEFFDGNGVYTHERLEKQGIIAFQIVSEDELNIGKFKTIIDCIERLCGLIYRYENTTLSIKEEILPTVMFVDSGSDINITIKLPEKAAEILAKLIADIWEWISSGKFIKNKKSNEAMEDAIELLKKVKQAELDKIMTSEEAELIRRGVIENAGNLILNNTITEVLLNRNRTISGRQLLIKQSNRLQLTEGASEEGRLDNNEQKN